MVSQLVFLSPEINTDSQEVGLQLSLFRTEYLASKENCTKLVGLWDGLENFVVAVVLSED